MVAIVFDYDAHFPSDVTGQTGVPLRVDVSCSHDITYLKGRRCADVTMQWLKQDNYFFISASIPSDFLDVQEKHTGSDERTPSVHPSLPWR